jgi:uncharacterized protein (DUF1499 family)
MASHAKWAGFTAMGRTMNGKGITCMVVWACCVLTMVQCSGGKPGMSGIVDGKLTPCPGSPNCVSSQSEDTSHFIDPLRYTGSLAAARERLLRVLTSMDRVTIMSETKTHIHLTFASRIFGFIDDVEFYFPQDAPVIHVRSASRVGYFDLGVNRKRIETIRKAFTR